MLHYVSCDRGVSVKPIELFARSKYEMKDDEWLGCQLAAQPSITKVCRQIRSEALPIFYGENDFVVTAVLGWFNRGNTHVAVASQWLSSLSLERIKQIRKMEARFFLWQFDRWRLIGNREEIPETEAERSWLLRDGSCHAGRVREQIWRKITGGSAEATAHLMNLERLLPIERRSEFRDRYMF